VAEAKHLWKPSSGNTIAYGSCGWRDIIDFAIVDWNKLLRKCSISDLNSVLVFFDNFMYNFNF
jgi:hypothetical protein